jgi:hypothetical protein
MTPAPYDPTTTPDYLAGERKMYADIDKQNDELHAELARLRGGLESMRGDFEELERWGSKSASELARAVLALLGKGE